MGKTTCARIFAKTINCEHPTPEGEACNECPSCRAFNEQRSYNINELDAASNNSGELGIARGPERCGENKVHCLERLHGHVAPEANFPEPEHFRIVGVEP